MVHVGDNDLRTLRLVQSGNPGVPHEAFERVARDKTRSANELFMS